MDEASVYLRELRAPTATATVGNADLIRASLASPEELIQLFNNALADIDPVQAADTAKEDPNEIVIRTLDFLRILKYMPPDDDPNAFRTAIFEGSADVIVPIMAWINARKDILKKRVYLANFLVQVEMPVVMMCDEEAVKTYQQYQSVLAKFVEIHKEHENLTYQTSVATLLDIIKKSEYDQECLSRKIDSVKSRVRTKQTNGQSVTLNDAKNLRSAIEIDRALSNQLKLEEKRFRSSEAKKAPKRRELQRIANMYNSVTPASLYSQMEAEVASLRKLVEEKLPKELKDLDRKYCAVQSIEVHSTDSLDDIKYLTSKVATIVEEVKRLESRVQGKHRNEALFVARQKAMAVGRKRRLMFEEAQLLSDQLAQLQSARQHILDERARKIGAIEAKDKVLRQYSNEINIKTDYYKQKKTELNCLKHETGILSSTKFILDGNYKEGELELEDMENQLGISGLSKTQSKLETISSMKNDVDEQNSQLLYDMSLSVNELYQKIAVKKSEMEDLVKSLSATREQNEVLQINYDKLKATFQKIYGDLECENEKNLKIIQGRKEKVANDELQFVELKALNSSLKLKTKRATQETINQSRDNKGDPKADPSRSMKQKLLGKIVEQERIVAGLQEELSNFDKFEAKCTQQKQMWTNTISIIEWKLRSKSKELQFTEDADAECFEYD